MGQRVASSRCPDGTDELLRVLVMALWNELALLQERNAPLRLMRIHIPATREGLARISLIRKEEVIGFIQGLFGGEKSIALSKRTCRALRLFRRREPYSMASITSQVIRRSQYRPRISERPGTISGS